MKKVKGRFIFVFGLIVILVSDLVLTVQAKSGPVLQSELSRRLNN